MKRFALALLVSTAVHGLLLHSLRWDGLYDVGRPLEPVVLELNLRAAVAVDSVRPPHSASSALPPPDAPPSLPPAPTSDAADLNRKPSDVRPAQAMPEALDRPDAARPGAGGKKVAAAARPSISKPAPKPAVSATSAVARQHPAAVKRQVAPAGPGETGSSQAPDKISSARSPPPAPSPSMVFPPEPASGRPAVSRPPPQAVASPTPAMGQGAASRPPPVPPSAPSVPATVPPRYKHRPPPVYPRLARKLGYQGTVLVEALVEASGRVGDARLARSSGHAVLDRSALKVVGDWTFEPARQGDEPVSMWVKVPIRFELAR